MLRQLLSLTLKQARRVVVALVGGTLLLVGAAMIVLPGPAFIVVPLGLAILATEYYPRQERRPCRSRRRSAA